MMQMSVQIRYSVEFMLGAVAQVTERFYWVKEATTTAGAVQLSSEGGQSRGAIHGKLVELIIGYLGDAGVDLSS